MRQTIILSFFKHCTLLLPFSLFFLAVSLHCAYAQCPRFAAAGEFPTAGEVLCNDSYAVGYSNSRRSPLWAAERITAEQMKAAQSIKEPPPPIQRDPRLNQGASTEDYKHSSWKPLALASTENMPSRKARQQSKLLSNLIPGDRDLEQKIWKKIEENTRKLAGEYGTFNILTGVIFGDSSQSFGKNRARLPSKIWKIIYVPRQGAAAIICDNAKPLHCVPTTVQEIENLCYIGLFPGLSESETIRALNPKHWPGL